MKLHSVTLNNLNDKCKGTIYIEDNRTLYKYISNNIDDLANDITIVLQTDSIIIKRVRQFNIINIKITSASIKFEII